MAFGSHKILQWEGTLACLLKAACQKVLRSVIIFQAGTIPLLEFRRCAIAGTLVLVMEVSYTMEG